MSFKEFLETPEVHPPNGVTQNIFNLVNVGLNPNPRRVYVKLLGLHIFVGAMTLFLCPQFGFGPFLLNHHGIMGPLLHLGTWACALFCGAFFMAASTIMAIVILRPEELEVVRKNQIVIYLLLSVGSMSVFLLLADMGNRQNLFSQYEDLLLWVLGGVIVAQGILYIARQFGQWRMNLPR